VQKHHNNFDFLRFLAAISVWFGHCYALMDLPDPLLRLTGFETFGSLGVTVFFVISGYFVTMSYAHHHSLRAYARNRSLRIMPALCAVVLLCTFALGPLITSLPLREYFADAVTWRYLKCLLVFPLQYDLPGVFAGNHSHAVNGSLWTLQHEVRLYVAIALLGALGILRPRVMFALLATLCAIRIYGIVEAPDVQAKLLGIRSGKLELAVKLASEFACGAFFYLVKEKIPLKKEGLLMCLLVIGASIFWKTPASNLAFDLAFSYVIIYAGFFKFAPLQGFSKYGDFSYGIYLYAFPMQQLCLHLFGNNVDFGVFLISSLVLTLVCGIFSWYAIEKPALGLKRA
jgi:peptidoglycan/LPS O-acetylase OafA/YrhL